MNQSDHLLAPVTNSQSSGPSARQRRGLQDDVAVALGGDVLDLGEQKLADSATAHVAGVRARAWAARSAPGVGCEAGFRRVLSQRPARAPFPPSEQIDGPED
jgi:hypothetical protein